MAYGGDAKTKGVRAKQKAETRARILQAALNAFAERGFEGASVRDIAAAANVNHGLIKYHFTDKDRLWKAAVGFLFERLDAEVTPTPEEENLPRRERLHAWVRRYVRYCARHPEHARIMVQVVFEVRGVVYVGQHEPFRFAPEFEDCTEMSAGHGNDVHLRRFPCCRFAAHDGVITPPVVT